MKVMQRVDDLRAWGRGKQTMREAASVHEQS